MLAYHIKGSPRVTLGIWFAIPTLPLQVGTLIHYVYGDLFIRVDMVGTACLLYSNQLVIPIATELEVNRWYFIGVVCDYPAGQLWYKFTGNDVVHRAIVPRYAEEGGVANLVLGARYDQGHFLGTLDCVVDSVNVMPVAISYYTIDRWYRDAAQMHLVYNIYNTSEPLLPEISSLVKVDTPLLNTLSLDRMVVLRAGWEEHTKDDRDGSGWKEMPFESRIVPKKED